MAHYQQKKAQPDWQLYRNVIAPKDRPGQAGGLIFRLPSSVTLRQESDGFALVLDYPLKFLRLNKIWQPIFACLSAGDSITLADISSLVPWMDPLELESFLTKLVRRGFLEQRGIPKQDNIPSVSIIIPVRNRPVEIRACLTSLAKLNYPSEKIEIIVVDDCSSDTTPDVIREFPVRLLSMRQHRQASFCRNMAARHARNEILAFIDSDCEADQDWLLALTPAFREDCVAAVGGMIDSYYATNLLDRYEKVQSSLMVSSWYKRSGEMDRFFYVPSCNFLIRRDRFLQLNGFKIDQHVGEDVDLCWRLQNKGYQVDYRPIGVVYHKHRNRLLPFCNRRFDYGTSEPQLHKLHEDRRKTIVFPPLITIFWLALVCFTLTGKISFLLLTLAVPLYSFFLTSKKIRSKNGPVTRKEILRSVPRSYCAWIYHLCAFVSRYYLLASLLLLPLVPAVSCIMMTMHVIVSFGQYIIKKPCLSFPVFFFYFSLEQLSYQTGVWWGSLANRYFGSIFPKASFVGNADLAR